MPYAPHLTRGAAWTLALLGASHLLVDAVSIGTLVRAGIRGDALALATLYLALAFGAQGPVGFLLDTARVARHAAWAGALTVVAGWLLLPLSPLAAVTFVGLGNALFHLGGGVVAFELTPGRASAPGIYVAPGAIGLTLGLVLGPTTAALWPFALALAACAVPLWPLHRVPRATVAPPAPDVPQTLIALGALLVLSAVAIRALVGLAMSFPWKTTLLATVLLTAAVVLGKALGGVVADRFGWVRTSTVALALALPLMLFGRDAQWLALAGVLLFNVPMAVTLTATHRAMPHRPATAFGLTCSALAIGSGLVYAFSGAPFATNAVAGVAIAVAIVAIASGVTILTCSASAQNVTP